MVLIVKDIHIIPSEIDLESFTLRRSRICGTKAIQLTNPTAKTSQATISWMIDKGCLLL